MLHELPDRLSLSLAAKVMGLSPFCFRNAFIKTGAVEYSADQLNGRFYVNTASLERAIGREITFPEVRAADLALQPIRDYQFAHRRKNQHAIF